MSAVIQIIRLTGSGPTSIPVTNTNSRIDASDSNSVASTANPIVIPPSGTNYSWSGTYQLYCSSPPVTLVCGFQLYTDGVNELGNGVELLIGQTASYTQATGSTGDGNVSSVATSDVFGFTQSSPFALTGSTSTTGAFGNYFVLQYNVGANATAGATGEVPIYVQWSES